MQVSQRSLWSSSPGRFTGAVFFVCLVAMLVGFAPAAMAAAQKQSYIVVLKDDVAHPANVAQRHEENRGAKIGHIYGSAIEGLFG